MKISIVSTLYKSAEYIEEFHSRISQQVAENFGDDYEIVFVNDGSPDNSLDLAVELSRKDPHVVIIDLSRNFGHHKAMMTGLAKSQGDLVFLIDSDLEEQPEWLSDFKKQMDQSDCDVVYGVQKLRKGSAFERITGQIFYRAFRLMSKVGLPDNIVTARLMTRSYVDALVAHKEREMIIGGLWVVTGFRQEKQVVRKLSSSPTTYTTAAKFRHFVNAITSFSSLPLVFTFYAGLIISMTAVVFIFFIVLQYFQGTSPPDGYRSIIASIWLFSGLIIFFLGVQGIYISTIFTEVKQRPYSIVRNIYRHGQRSDK